MTTSKVGSRILQGAKEALAYAKGENSGEDFVIHYPASSERTIVPRPNKTR